MASPNNDAITKATITAIVKCVALLMSSGLMITICPCPKSTWVVALVFCTISLNTQPRPFTRQPTFFLGLTVKPMRFMAS